MDVHFCLVFFLNKARTCKTEGKQTVRCQLVLKKEQLQGTVRGVREVNRKRKVAIFFITAEKKNAFRPRCCLCFV